MYYIISFIYIYIYIYHITSLHFFDMLFKNVEIVTRSSPYLEAAADDLWKSGLQVSGIQRGISLNGKSIIHFEW